MSKEKKSVELKDEDLENVSGGVGVRGSFCILVEAGYYRHRNDSSKIYYLPSYEDHYLADEVGLKVYALDQATGHYVNSNTTEPVQVYTLITAYVKITDVSSITFVG